MTQDGAKLLFLCFECDSRLIGPLEKKFAESFFRCHLAAGPRGLRYDSWLQRFCAATCWRALAVIREEGGPPNFSLRQLEASDLALVRWHQIVAGLTEECGPFQFHILPLNRGPSEGEARTAHFVGHFAYTDASSGAAFVIVKLQDLMVVGSIVDPNRAAWEGTSIGRSGIWGQGDGRYPVPVALQGFYENELKRVADLSRRPVAEFKAGHKQPARRFRRRPDYRVPLVHWRGTGRGMKVAVELGPADETWRGFYVAFSTKDPGHGATIAVGLAAEGAWKAPTVQTLESRIGEWNLFRSELAVQPEMAIFVTGPLVPNIVVFGEPGRRQHFVALDGLRSQCPPVPPELLHLGRSSDPL